MKILAIVLVVLVILFVAGWAMGSHNDDGGLADVQRLASYHPIAKSLADRFSLPSLDLCTLTKKCDGTNTITVGLAGLEVDMSPDKTSRKLNIPKLPGGMSLDYQDYEVGSDGKPLSVQALHSDDNVAWPVSIFSTSKGGKLTFRCVMPWCKLKVK